MMTAPNFHGMHPPPHFAMEKCLTEKDDKTMDSPRHDQLAAFKALVSASSQLKALVSASSFELCGGWSTYGIMTTVLRNFIAYLQILCF